MLERRLAGSCKVTVSGSEIQAVESADRSTHKEMKLSVRRKVVVVPSYGKL